MRMMKNRKNKDIAVELIIFCTIYRYNLTHGVLGVGGGGGEVIKGRRMPGEKAAPSLLPRPRRPQK